MFLLPPVPGAPVYMASGVLLTAVAEPQLGYWPAAFYAMGVDEAEMKWQAVLGPDGKIYLFTVLGMGGAAAPLIWGRVAAWLGRHLAATFDVDSLRIQIFVDDPLLAARGTRTQRRRHLVIGILLFLALGLKLSWKKKQLGAVVTWIGAELGISLEELTIAITARFVEKVLKETNELQTVRSIPVHRLRSYVGALT